MAYLCTRTSTRCRLQRVVAHNTSAVGKVPSEEAGLAQGGPAAGAVEGRGDGHAALGAAVRGVVRQLPCQAAEQQLVVQQAELVDGVACMLQLQVHAVIATYVC